MLDQLVLAREASTRDAARAFVEMAVETGGRGMSSSDVTSQIAFASIMLEATVVRTVMALIDCAEIEAWSRKWGKWSSFRIASGQNVSDAFTFFLLGETHPIVIPWSNIAVKKLSWSKRYASWTRSVAGTHPTKSSDMIDKPAEPKTKTEAKRALLSMAVEIEMRKLRKKKIGSPDCLRFVLEHSNSLTREVTEICAASHCKV
jgi:hypothetical protein